jgi:hypothetical protein
VDADTQYNKYYLMPKEMRQDVVIEQYKRGTQTKISSFFKHGLNNTKYVGYLKCFKTDVKTYITTLDGK